MLICNVPLFFLFGANNLYINQNYTKPAKGFGIGTRSVGLSVKLVK